METWLWPANARENSNSRWQHEKEEDDPFN
jgi:hypothetical protein